MNAAVHSEDPSAGREPLWLGVADVGLLTGMVLVGQLSHGVDPLTEPLVALETVVPFVIGWLVIALVAGIYSSKVSSSIGRAARVTTVTWVAAANVGLLLRASPLFEGGATWPFPLVMTGFGLLVLGSWRIGYAAYLGSQS